jgi:hypothetical protein
MVNQPDPALLRAIKFFEHKGAIPNNKMGLYSDSSGRMFVNLFVASPVQSKNKFKFNGDYMPNWMPAFIERPITLHKIGDHFDHPTIANAARHVNEAFQETKAVGRIKHLFEPDQKMTWRGIGEILVSKVKQFLKSLDTDEVPMFSSPSVAYTGDDYDIREGIPMHVTLTDDPAFPPEISRITGVCEGDESACMAKLAQATRNNYEAGSTCKVCFTDAMRDLVLNCAVNQNNNTSLKMFNASIQNEDMPNENSQNDASGQAGESKSPAQLSTELIQKEAKDAVTKALADHTNRINNEKPDPVQTFKKAYGLENEDNKEDKTDNIKKDEVASKEDLEKVKKELAEQKAINRRNAIAKIIPLRMVTDVKAGGVSESLLSEVVDYWMKTPLEPKDISEFYAKQESQIEVMTPTQKVAKASVSNDSIASQISNQEPQFDAPDANASDNKDDKYANATVNGDPAWFLDFSGMLVTNPSKNTGKGAPRRLID